MGGAFLITLSFLALAAGLGRGLGERGFLPAFASGLAIFIFSAEVLGLAGGLGFFPRAGFTFLVPIFLAIHFWAPLPRFRFPRLGGEPWLLLAATVIALLFFSLTWIPDSMPDPLWYHLTAARWWTEAARFGSGQQNIALFQAGAWDALLLWGNFLLGSAGEGGMVPIQLFGQWIHFGAALGSGFFLYRLSRHFFSLGPESRAALTLTAMLGISQLNTIALAKNDWGAIFFLLASLCVWRENAKKSGALQAGVFFGLAFSTKSPVAFLVLLFLGRPRRDYFYFALGGAAAALPWLVRNYLGTGDPFFPALQSFFPGIAGPSWKKFAFYEGSALSWKTHLAKDILLDSLFVPAAFVAFLFSSYLPAAQKWFTRATVLGALVFFAKVGPKAEYRLFGAGALLLIACGAGALLFLAEKLPSRAQRTARAVLVLLALVFPSWLSHFPWKAPLDAMAQPLPAVQIRTHFGGSALAWIRLNLPREKKIASANEFRLYYLSSFRAFRIWDNPGLDRALYEAKDASELVSALRREGVDYLIFTRADWDIMFRKEALDALESVWALHRETIVFGNENAKVIDVNALFTAMGSHATR